MKENYTTSPIKGVSSANDTIWLKLISFFRKKNLIALIVAAVLPFFSNAGNVEKSVTFMSQSRALSLYVPNSYSPTLKYKLIVSLHGAGDNSVNFRNAISPISSNTGSPFYNCIIICPDGGSDPSKSFQTPAGDEEIIRVARDSAKKWYNIDTNYIYLNGFSLGARSALYYGLKNYSLWKGMFLWTPAVQSIAEADNKSYFKYSYSNANKIPICMTVGANDAGYVTKVQYIKNILVDSNGIVQLRVIAGLGHSIPPTFADEFCSGFVDNFFTSMSALDAGISKINAPKVYTCSSSIIPTVRLMNRGTTTLTSVVINYRIDNGTLQTHNWSGTLASLTSQNVTLPAITSAAGKHALKVFTSNPNAGVDGNTSNDNVTDSVTIVITGRSLPQFDGFELQPTDVLDQLINPDGMYSYYLSTTAKTGTYSAYVPNFLYPIPGEKDDLITYPLNLSSAPNPVLTFDLAYVSRNSGLSDTLEVSISTDCGKTYTTIYKKFGLNLPTTSPTFKSTQFVPTAGQWRTESVSLGAYTSATTAFIRFRNICNYQNDLYFFTATPVNGGPAPGYQWKVNGVNVGTNSPTYTTTTLTNGQVVTCVMTSNLSGVVGSPATSTGITMTVNSAVTPAVTTSITSGTNPACAGSSVTFTAAPTNGGSAPSYQWKVNGVNAGTNSSTFTTTTLTNGQVVTCVLTSNAACASPATATSSGITMTINTVSAPSVSAAITSGANPGCAGASVTFTATPANGGTIPAYQWKVNGVNAGTNSSTFTTTTLTNGQVVTCVLTSNLACASPTTATSTGITMTINPSVTPAVSASLTTGTNPACAGTSLTFTAVPTNGGITPAYQWKVNGVNVGTNSATFTTSTLTNGQVVTCVLTSNATCASPATATSTGVTMTINAIPATPVISQAGSVLTSSSASGNQWYLNGNPIAGATNQTYTVAQNGSYTVIVTTNGCSSAASAPKLMNTVGIGQSTAESIFAVYPNPNDGNFTVSFKASVRSNYILELKNGLGQLVYREVLTDYAGTYSKQLNIAEFGRGIYFISLLNTRSEIVKKVMVY
ncbi:MAG: T9SS type A sorting domain-containing protein [Bacteroidetes bacterium]|nr:T9SS type A sorting domain-containing protein [Bacteroidota bacterium]